MSKTKTIGYKALNKIVSIGGTPDSEFNLYIKQGSNYYTWDTDAFTPVVNKLKFQKIPSSGIFTKVYVIPEVSADTSYDFYIDALPGTVLNIPTTNEQKIATLFQKGTKTATFTTTSSASLVIQNSGSAGTDLTGGTLTDTFTTLNQTGTITKSGAPLLYIHDTPSWDNTTGGNWTNSNYIEAPVNIVGSSTVIFLDEGQGTNIASGYAVTGDSITDEITVSAISGDKITLSAGQHLNSGDSLAFSKGAWKIYRIAAEISGSGTNTITMSMDAKAEKIGIANLASVCSVDSFVSVKPNAFPVPNVKCPAGGSVDIDVVAECTNYLGQARDIDANQTGKSYVIHSVPNADTPTAFRPTGEVDEDGELIYVALAVNGTSSVDAGASMGSAGTGEVRYTAQASMIAGDTDFFFYKTTDAQSTPVTSSTTQGKISITIV